MFKKHSWIVIMAVILPLALLAGCGEYGKVDQGRVVMFDKDKRMATMVSDVSADPANPDYTHLPAAVYTLPTDPNESGAEPKAGLRMKLDTKNRQIVIFDPAAQNFKTIDYTLIDQKENVDKSDPLVVDKKFPAVDRDKKTITIYSKRQAILTTFSLPEEYFALPDQTWDAGDEARIYYKQEGKALRYMNISKTDIYKK
jgi:outer membrane murein-binding lipoprotein Lpp